MLAALALGLWTGAVAVVTWAVFDRRQRQITSRTAARLQQWERIARHHNALRVDAGQVSRDR